MAANYDPLSSQETIESIGGAATRNVYVVNAVSKPSGVYWSQRFPLPEFSRIGQPTRIDLGVVDAELNTTAVYIEQLLELPNVAGIVYVQDVSAANFLIDLLEITVADDSGGLTAVLRWSVANLSISLASEAVQQLAAELNGFKAA